MAIVIELYFRQECSACGGRVFGLARRAGEFKVWFGGELLFRARDFLGKLEVG